MAIVSLKHFKRGSALHYNLLDKKVAILLYTLVTIEAGSMLALIVSSKSGFLFLSMDIV